MIKVWVLLAVFALGVVSCSVATPATAGPPTASPPSQVWILQPADGANVLLNHILQIQLQGASFHGIEWFVIKISDAALEWKVAPQSTGSGGAQYGTMFFTQTTWTPHAEGDFTISARAINASGVSPWATVHVHVIDLSKATHTATPLPGQPAGPGVKATWTPTAAHWQVTAKVNANCRSGPGIVYNETGFVLKGDTVEVVGRNTKGTWLELVHPSGKGFCWVSILAFEVPFEMKPLPVIWAPSPAASSKHGGSEEASSKGCTVTNPSTGQTSCVSPCPAGAAPGKACTP